jgi:hypothetical protein
LVVAFMALAVFAGPASASPDLNAAVRTAQSVWPSVAQRCGPVQIVIGALSSVNADSSAETYYSSCLVKIAPATMSTVSDVQLCSLMVHEYGHLAGLPDSSDPNSVMYPQIRPLPVCETGSASPSAAQFAANARQERRETIKDALGGLRKELRKTRAALRHAHGARRARLTTKRTRLEKRIRRLKAELKKL